MILLLALLHQSQTTPPLMPLKLILRNPLPHRTRTTHPTGNHLQQIIHIIRPGPLLMRHHIALQTHLGLLDERAISAHALLRKRLGELMRDQGGGVQAGEGDELPAVAELAEAGDVGFLFRLGHGGFPVEGGGEVVC
jgi:hypothetical protein